MEYAVAAEWMLLALIAAILSVRLGLSAALMEIIVGVIGSNITKMEITPWITFLAGFGAVVLTFLSGAEIDSKNLRENLAKSLVIGILSFLIPFIAGLASAEFIFGWAVNAAKIAGISLSTTSVAVVYAVMVESGLSASSLGQAILAACFVTDFGTVVALGILFTGFSMQLLYFMGAMAAAVFVCIPIAKRLFEYYGGRVSEPEIKFVFLILLGLAYLAVAGGTEAILPAYIIGLAMAGFFKHYKKTLAKMRAIAFAFFTPFYFIKAGVLVSLGTVYSMAGAVAVFLLLKIAAKFVGVLPVTKLFGYTPRTSIYSTLLMSTGLTFGTISALYGLTNNYIDSSQYSILVAAVILSAVVPAVIAQKYFFPPGIVSQVRGGMKAVSEREAEGR